MYKIVFSSIVFVSVSVLIYENNLGPNISLKVLNIVYKQHTSSPMAYTGGGDGGVAAGAQTPAPLIVNAKVPQGMRFLPCPSRGLCTPHI